MLLALMKCYLVAALGADTGALEDDTTASLLTLSASLEAVEAARSNVATHDVVKTS